MSETYEINLLRNVQATEGKSSVSKEFLGLKRKQRKENKKKGPGYALRSGSVRVSRHGSYENEVVGDHEQESTIDITV